MFNIIKKYFIRPAPQANLGVGDDAALITVAEGMQLAIPGRHRAIRGPWSSWFGCAFHLVRSRIKGPKSQRESLILQIDSGERRLRFREH